MKIKFKNKKKELWLESDGTGFLIHRGFITITNKETGQTTQQRIDPSFYGANLTQALCGLLNKAMIKSEASTIKDMYYEILEWQKLILNKVEI